MRPMASVKRALRRTGLLAVAAAALASPAWAQVEIQWWHAMAGPNGERIVKIANDFNASQHEYKIVPTFKGSYADTMNAGIAAFRAGGAPHILQVFEVGTATMMAAKGAIKPVYQLMQETGEPFDPKSYLTAVTGYYSTAKGEMLSFPFNSSTEVMWVNLDALKKAGIDKVPATWPDTFAAATKLHSAGYDKCGISTAWFTWANIEQFTAWHNIQLSTKANGLDGFDTVLTFNKSPVVVRHFENLARYQKDKTFDYSGRTNEGEGRFTSGECPLFITSSAFLGAVKGAAKFNWTTAFMPYYPDVKGAPQNSIIGGASLWVMGGKSKEEYKGVAKFLTYLSKPEVQAWWHEQTGYLPITNAAYELAKKQGYYDKNPAAEVSIKQMTLHPPTENSRGLRLGNLAQMRDVWMEEIEQVLAGKKTAQAGLDAAAARGNQMLRQFQRTVR
jgi:sn-glycerol 3-phosphate transport system substrate-binding protein